MESPGQAFNVTIELLVVARYSEAINAWSIKNAPDVRRHGCNG
jgi:hypothetical protein